MSIFSLDSKLSDLLFADPAVLPILNRFGINLGVGEKTIHDICEESGVDPALLLAVVNAYFNKNFFPEDLLRQVNRDDLIEFLRKTDSYYADVQLPNIERHFNILINTAPADNSSIRLLAGFFMELKKELLSRINLDESEIFSNGNASKNIPAESLENMIACDSAIEDKLSDLMTFFIVHLRGEYDRNLCNAVLQAISALERDIKCNNRIRNNILFPSLAIN